MAGKGRKKAKAAPGARVKPFLLALAAVAVVFGAAVLVALLAGDPPQPPRAVAPVVTQVPLPEPPAREPAPATIAELIGKAAELPADQPPVGQPPADQPMDGPEVPPVPAEAVPPVPEKPVQTAVLPPPVLPPVAGGVPLWQKNAVPGRLPTDRPAIAVVIDDLGVDRKRSARIVTLPGPLTLAWLPYAQDLREQAKAARAKGHELLLHIPMEPSVKADPGPGALLVGLAQDEILRRFAAALASFDGYVGVNNHMGSRFTADRAAMAPVLAEVQRRGLLWLDSRTTPTSAAPGLAREMKLPFAGRDVFLDNVETVAAVRAQLAKTEAVARQQGVAIAIGHPHDATFEALAGWLPELQKRGFTLVPVSAIVRARHAGG